MQRATRRQELAGHFVLVTLVCRRHGVGQAIAGYLEYSRSWNEQNYIYISSVQIQERYHNPRLILKLLDRFRASVEERSYSDLRQMCRKRIRLL